VLFTENYVTLLEELLQGRYLTSSRRIPCWPLFRNWTIVTGRYVLIEGSFLNFSFWYCWSCFTILLLRMCSVQLAECLNVAVLKYETCCHVHQPCRTGRRKTICSRNVIKILKLNQFWNKKNYKNFYSIDKLRPYSRKIHHILLKTL
jgi:hypothetical protein